MSDSEESNDSDQQYTIVDQATQDQSQDEQDYGYRRSGCQ